MIAQRLLQQVQSLSLIHISVITILKTILKADNVAYMLISAVIFAMFHINSLKQSGVMPEISNLLIYFILGMGWAYVYLRTNNIVSAIVLHMFRCV